MLFTGRVDTSRVFTAKCVKFTVFTVFTAKCVNFTVFMCRVATVRGFTIKMCEIHGFHTPGLPRPKFSQPKCVKIFVFMGRAATAKVFTAKMCEIHRFYLSGYHGRIFTSNCVKFTGFRVFTFFFNFLGFKNFRFKCWCILFRMVFVCKYVVQLRYQ